MNNILMQLDRLRFSLLALGSRRLMVLGLVGLAVFAATGLIGYQLSRPTYEMLYAGLDRTDVSRSASVLSDAGIPFDIGSDGTSLFVRYGETARARMLLAQKELPHGTSAGYELFDKVGSLGLSSFMQEVTKVRAVEGELARTIELLRGIKAARVHIVMPDEGSFRRAKQAASASVVIRSDTPDDNTSASAIRHLVAAAVPGMTLDEVTVIDADGTILASGEDSSKAEPGRLRSLEKTVSQEMQDQVRKTLAPYLSAKNFQISVEARLNTDKKQTTETVYNPDSKVERSVRVVKETQQTQNSTGQQQSASVQNNLPQGGARGTDGRQSNEDNQKREELTNYEISSKSIQTVSGGYSIDQLAVALVINKAGLAGTEGAKPTQEQIDAQRTDLEQLVASVVGLRKDRGDTLKISVVDFLTASNELEPASQSGFMEFISRYMGLFISSLGLIAAVLLLIFLGLRPTMKALLSMPLPAPPTLAPPAPEQMAAMQNALPGWSQGSQELLPQPRQQLKARLEHAVTQDETQSAALMKQWMQQPRQAA